MKMKERIEWLERALFGLEMKDRWDNEDYTQAWKWRAELRELKQWAGEEA